MARAIIPPTSDYVKQKQQDVGGGHIPSGKGKVGKAHPCGDKADKQCADKGGGVISERQHRSFDRGHGKVAPRPCYLVVDHQQV